MKQLTLTTALLCAFFGVFAQKDFYDLDKIQDIKLVFGYNDWDTKLDAQKAGAQDYILALSCTINGEKFDSVGVKYKGNSSYNASRKKNPLHIKLDWKRDQSYNNVTSIKLSNIYADPSYIREPLSYKLLRNYMDCPEANFAKVYVEGSYYGLMTNVEPINNKFVGDHFGSSENTFVKCNPNFKAVFPSGNNIPNLVFLSYDSTKYKNIYELESKTGWKDLIALMDTLSKKPNSLNKVLDIDKAIWMLAFNNVFVNLDSYSGSFAQNYYLYKDNNNRFIPIVWDLNMSFASFNSTGESTPASNLAQMKYDLHSTNAARPLIKVLLSNPTYKKMYIAHMRTMLKECFVNKKYETEAIAMRTFIEPEVKTDVNPLSTYTAFQNGMTATGGSGGPGQNVIGISTLMEARKTYLLALPQFTAEAPSIQNVDFAPKSAKVGDAIWVNAKLEGSTNAYVFYREDGEDIFEKVQMYDDGLHQDGSANDGTFGASLTAKDFKMQYYIYAENNDAGIFSPERAEHEFYTLALQNAGTSSVVAGDLVINEFMAANKNTVKDPSDDKADDWAELYNNTNQTISLDNLYLTDDNTKKTKWAFPTGIKIPAKSRIIVWLDEDQKATIGYHANFKLSASGEQLLLSKADGTVLDSMSYTSMDDEQSLERCPDGTGAFKFTTSPTFNSTNCKPLAANDITEFIDYQIFPNPVSNILTIEGEGIKQVELMNINGQLLLSQKINETNQHQVSVENIDTGIYFLRINKNVVKRIVVIK